MWIHRFLGRLGQLRTAVTRLPELLNWGLAVIEPMVVLALVSLVGLAAYWLVFGPEGGGQQKRFLDLLKQLSENWKALLLLLVVLFYRTVRTFFEQAEEAWGVKRKRPLSGEIERKGTPSGQ